MGKVDKKEHKKEFFIPRANFDSTDGLCKIGNSDIGWGKCGWHQPDGQCSIKHKDCDWDAKVEPEPEEPATPPTTEMQCPKCGHLLAYNGMKYFETLSEHVACLANDPKWNPPARPTFTCKGCFGTILDRDSSPPYFDEYGEIYTGRFGVIPPKYWDALNSLAFKIWFQTNDDMRRTNSEYEAELRAEKMKLPDSPKVKSDETQK